MMMMMTDESSLSCPNRAPEERRIKIRLMLEGAGVIKNSCFCLHVAAAAAAASDPLVVAA